MPLKRSYMLKNLIRVLVFTKTVFGIITEIVIQNFMGLIKARRG